MEGVVREVARAATAAVALGGDEEEGRERRRAAAEHFERRIERGDFDGLFDGRVRELMTQAAADRSLDAELGALRIVLTRVLSEEEDPVRQALGVARVTQAAARVARTRQQLAAAGDTELQSTLTEVLIELGKEEEEKLARREAERLAEDALPQLLSLSEGEGWM